MSKVSADELEKAISKTLEEWANVTEEAAAEGVWKTAQEAVEKLRSAHPAGSGEWGSWDDYNAGWSVKKDGLRKKAGAHVTVHNTSHYQLTHLLENGHALQNGGRARAFPHIAPVAEEAESSLLDNIKKKISNN